MRFMKSCRVKCLLTRRSRASNRRRQHGNYYILLPPFDWEALIIQTGEAYTVQRRVGDVRAWWRWMTETIYISNRLFECRGEAPTQAARRGHLLAETMTSINITEARDVINCWRQESVTPRQSLQWRSGEQWSSRFVIWLLSVRGVHYSTACVFIIPACVSNNSNSSGYSTGGLVMTLIFTFIFIVYHAFDVIF